MNIKLAELDVAKIMRYIHRITKTLAINNGNNPNDFKISIEPALIDAILSSQLSKMRRYLRIRLLQIFGCNPNNVNDINDCQQCKNCIICNTVISCGESITNVHKELDSKIGITKSVKIMMVIICNQKSENFYLVLLDNSYIKAPRYHKGKNSKPWPDMYLCSGRGSNITDVYMLDFKRQHDTATGLNYVVLTGISPKKMNLIERLHSCLSAAIILNATLAIDKAI